MSEIDYSFLKPIESDPFDNFCNNKYYEYLDECDAWDEKPMSREQYFQKNSLHLRELYKEVEKQC